MPVITVPKIGLGTVDEPHTPDLSAYPEYQGKEWRLIDDGTDYITIMVIL